MLGPNFRQKLIPPAWRLALHTRRSGTSVAGRDFFKAVSAAPTDPIFGVDVAFRNDTSPFKVNLGVGAYRTEEGVPHVFKAVQDVEHSMVNDESLFKEYTSIDGKPELKELTQNLVFGNKPGMTGSNILSCQTLSGTGALKVTAEFLHRCCPETNSVYVPKPTWGNHHQIFKSSRLKVLEYPYWDAERRALHFTGMIDTLRSAQKGQAVVLHAVGHNPTGVDPTKKQWEEILDVVVERELLPVMDLAYQGFTSGDLDEDAYSVRLFKERGIQMVVCQSFAKSMGLYGERIGMLHMVCRDAEEARIVLSQVKCTCRASYSTPPIHGANIVQRVLTDSQKFNLWKEELKLVASRLTSIRLVSSGFNSAHILSCG
eukprot:GHVN01099595.1.p1 GENE.GHVN01099595.1~~GHVN01099595.1.p1  ORF type:complete len:372 (+),score=28.17 GHVN01099595.1:189-1304(+)